MANIWYLSSSTSIKKTLLEEYWTRFRWFCRKYHKLLLAGDVNSEGTELNLSNFFLPLIEKI